ncbi:hypothetical protein SO802_019736 [Lithocarpus litseifolius]|uniref:DC1 domain-containing protein n=1 Tax=Lithocarpus litseifolius TaxID=425828 RepID=A0AAW2CQ05_9ROSI
MSNVLLRYNPSLKLKFMTTHWPSSRGQSHSLLIFVVNKVRKCLSNVSYVEFGSTANVLSYHTRSNICSTSTLSTSPKTQRLINLSTDFVNFVLKSWTQINYGNYYCSSCDYVAHLDCAMDEVGRELTFKGESKDKEPIESSIKVGQYKIEITIKIKHSSHEHDLKLTDEQENYEICDGCIRPIFPPFTIVLSVLSFYTNLG